MGIIFVKYTLVSATNEVLVMKFYITSILLFIVVSFTGCYTQLAVRDRDYKPSDDYYDQPATENYYYDEEDSTYYADEEYYYEDESPYRDGETSYGSEGNNYYYDDYGVRPNYRRYYWGYYPGSSIYIGYNYWDWNHYYWDYWDWYYYPTFVYYPSWWNYGYYWNSWYTPYYGYNYYGYNNTTKYKYRTNNYATRNNGGGRGTRSSRLTDTGGRTRDDVGRPSTTVRSGGTDRSGTDRKRIAGQNEPTRTTATRSGVANDGSGTAAGRATTSRDKIDKENKGRTFTGRVPSSSRRSNAVDGRRKIPNLTPKSRAADKDRVSGANDGSSEKSKSKNVAPRKRIPIPRSYKRPSSNSRSRGYKVTPKSNSAPKSYSRPKSSYSQPKSNSRPKSSYTPRSNSTPSRSYTPRSSGSSNRSSGSSSRSSGSSSSSRGSSSSSGKSRR